jgi:hypothetical protein
MTEEIVFKQPLKKQILVVDEEGVSYTETGGIGMGDTAHVYFHQIDAVVRNPTGPVITVQTGRQLYSIQYQPQNETHQSVLRRLIAGVQAAQ